MDRIAAICICLSQSDTGAFRFVTRYGAEGTVISAVYIIGIRRKVTERTIANTSNIIRVGFAIYLRASCLASMDQQVAVTWRTRTARAIWIGSAGQKRASTTFRITRINNTKLGRRVEAGCVIWIGSAISISPLTGCICWIRYTNRSHTCTVGISWVIITICRPSGTIGMIRIGAAKIDMVSIVTRRIAWMPRAIGSITYTITSTSTATTAICRKTMANRII